MKGQPAKGAPPPPPLQGRPLRVYQPVRSIRRWLLLLGDLTRLLEEHDPSAPFSAIADFDLNEGVGGGSYTPGDDGGRHQAKESGGADSLEGRGPAAPHATPRDRQMGAVLQADLFVGLHGADLSVIAMAKKTAFVLELAVRGRDTAGAYEKGYFAPLAASRGIGYARVPCHSVAVGLTPQQQKEKGHWRITLRRTQLLSSPTRWGGGGEGAQQMSTRSC